MKNTSSYNETIKAAVIAKFGKLYSQMETKEEKSQCAKFIKDFQVKNPKS